MISPLELIRTKLQSQKQSYRELTDCIRSAVETEGWLSLWRGLGPTLLRDVPFSAMYWYNYEKGKSWLCEHYNTRETNFTITFISGAVSGSVSASAGDLDRNHHCDHVNSQPLCVNSCLYFFQIASIVTLPFDVVKTRRQVELGELQAKNCKYGINYLLSF